MKLHSLNPSDDIHCGHPGNTRVRNEIYCEHSQWTELELFWNTKVISKLLY